LVGLLWTSDQLVAETSTWQHTTLTTDKYPRHRWDSNPRSQHASGPAAHVRHFSVAEQQTTALARRLHPSYSVIRIEHTNSVPTSFLL